MAIPSLLIVLAESLAGGEAPNVWRNYLKKEKRKEKKSTNFLRLSSGIGVMAAPVFAIFVCIWVLMGLQR